VAASRPRAPTAPSRTVAGVLTGHRPTPNQRPFPRLTGCRAAPSQPAAPGRSAAAGHPATAHPPGRPVGSRATPPPHPLPHLASQPSGASPSGSGISRQDIAERPLAVMLVIRLMSTWDGLVPHQRRCLSG
jgi:hypothetical protein